MSFVFAPLSLKKSFAKKIFGLNLTLHAREARGVAEIQWASVAEAHQKISEKGLCFVLVPRAGLEPACLTAPPPQGGKSANFSTWAGAFLIILQLLLFSLPLFLLQPEPLHSLPLRQQFPHRSSDSSYARYGAGDEPP